VKVIAYQKGVAIILLIPQAVVLETLI
jgi:hypothetical protein